jgi:hypothetical protein
MADSASRADEDEGGAGRGRLRARGPIGVASPVGPHEEKAGDRQREREGDRKLG